MKKIIPFKKQIYFKNNVGEITSISLEHTLAPTSDNLIKGDFIISGDYKMTESSISTDPFEFCIPCDIELNERYKLDKVQINIDDFYYEVIDSKILEVNIDVLLDKLEEEDIINEIPMKYVNIKELEEDLKEPAVEEDVTTKLEESEDLDEVIPSDRNNDIDDTVEENNTIEEVSKKEESECIVTNEIPKSEEKVENVMLEEVKETSERCIEDENYTKSIFSNFGSTEEEYRTYKVYIVREGDSLEQIITKYQINREELEKYNDLKELSIGDKIIIPYFYEDNK